MNNANNTAAVETHEAPTSHFCEHVPSGSVIPCSQVATTTRRASRHLVWNLCADHARQGDSIAKHGHPFGT